MSDDRTVRSERRPDGTVVKDYTTPKTGGMAWLRNNPFATTLATAAVLGASSWVFTVGGFVTNVAYAEDQDKLDTIIELIGHVDEKQTESREHAALDAEIGAAESRIEELELYVDGDPESKLTSARKSNIRRYNNIIKEAKREKAELERASDT